MEVKDYKNIKEIICESAERYKDQYAFVIKHKEGSEISYENITYGKLLEDINSFGTEMYEMGYKGKRVAIIGKNRYEWVVAHLANMFGNIISIPLDKDLQVGELENSLIRSKADCIIFDEKLLDFIKQIKEDGKTNLKEYICMSKIDDFKSVGEIMEAGRKRVEGGNTLFVDNKVDGECMSVLLFTSGTTSQSKAVMLSQRNVASNVYAMKLVEDIRSTDTNIAFLPFHHIFGSTCIIMMLACGVKTVFPDGLRYIKQNLQEYKVTLFVGVPVLIETIYKTIMKEIDKQGKKKLINNVVKISNGLRKIGIDLRRKLFKQVIDALGGELRLLISGGAPADPVISKGFIDLGIEIVQGYGLTETAPVIAAESKKYVRQGSVGKAMANDTVVIENPDEEGIGEIKVKGPNVMLGYYEMQEQTYSVLKDGWFYTGDLGYVDKDGYLFITGRNKNLIVLKNGKKIFPEELETLVSRIEFVKECMVFGMPDENDKNDVMLSVKIVYDKDAVKEKHGDIDFEEIRKIIWENVKEVNTSFPRYKHIQNMILTDEELIKTTTKKVKRQEEMKKILADK